MNSCSIVWSYEVGKILLISSAVSEHLEKMLVRGGPQGSHVDLWTEARGDVNTTNKAQSRST